MRCSCDQARREARAEVLRELIAALDARDDDATSALLDEGYAASRALSGYHPSPAPERASSTPPGGATAKREPPFKPGTAEQMTALDEMAGLGQEFDDRTEDDGFVTVWPALDSGVGLA